MVILFISSMVMFIGVVLFALSFKFSQEVIGFDILGLSIALMICSTLFGFVVLGLLVPVKVNTTTLVPNQIVRTKYNVMVEYGNGKTLSSSDTRVYNSDDDSIVVIEESQCNSYGLPISTIMKLANDEKPLTNDD